MREHLHILTDLKLKRVELENELEKVKIGETTIIMPKTTLNDYIEKERRNMYLGAKIKKHESTLIAYQVKNKIKPIDVPVTIKFTYYDKDKRKDLDNIEFVRKFILDGLVLAGILKNDNQKWVRGFEKPEFFVSKENPRVHIQFFREGV